MSEHSWLPVSFVEKLRRRLFGEFPVIIACNEPITGPCRNKAAPRTLTISCKWHVVALRRRNTSPVAIRKWAGGGEAFVSGDCETCNVLFGLMDKFANKLLGKSRKNSQTDRGFNGPGGWGSACKWKDKEGVRLRKRRRIITSTGTGVPSSFRIVSVLITFATRISFVQTNDERIKIINTILQKNNYEKKLVFFLRRVYVPRNRREVENRARNVTDENSAVVKQNVGLLS